MNLKDEINALSEEWSNPAISDASSLQDLVKMARENERMLCAIRLKKLITQYLMDEARQQEIAEPAKPHS